MEDRHARNQSLGSSRRRNATSAAMEPASKLTTVVFTFFLCFGVSLAMIPSMYAWDMLVNKFSSTVASAARYEITLVVTITTSAHMNAHD